MAILKLYPDHKDYEDIENRFLRELGACVNQWSQIDRQLFLLFRYGLGSETAPAAAVYYKQNSLAQRLSFVTLVLEQKLGAARVKNEWTPLAARISEELIPVRNIIVHHPARRMGGSKDGSPYYEYSIYIEPYQRLVSKKIKGLKGKECLKIEDLTQHGADVLLAHKYLVALVRRLDRGAESRA